MNEKQDLLKAAGFSDEFIEYIVNPVVQVHHYGLPSVDAFRITYGSVDTTELVIQDRSVNASAHLSIPAANRE